MKITPKEMQDVLDYIYQTPANEQSLAKVAVIERLTKYLSELSEEEQEALPNDLAADLRLADFRATLTQLSIDEDIDSLKTFVLKDLDPTGYRIVPPYYRAEYARLNAVGCMAIFCHIPKGHEDERDLWIFRGLDAIDLAISLFERMEESDSLFSSLLVKAEILEDKSLKEAAETTLLGIRQASDKEWRQKFVDLWKEINDKRFDLFFEPKGTSYINQLPLPKETIEEMFEEDSDIGLLGAKCLCVMEPYYDRSPILFVEKIEDVATPEIGELADKAKYIFCLDRIPPELRFDEGHPKANILYEVDEEDTSLYHELKDEED